MKLYSDFPVNGVNCCGNVTENHQGFPESIKAGKAWFRANRGDMR